MAEISVFAVPVISVRVQSRRRGATLGGVMRRVGATWGTPAAYGLATAVLVPLALLAWATLALTPAEALQAPGAGAAR